MKKCIFFFLLITYHIFSNVAITENAPSSLIQGLVSSITGDLYTLEEDILIQGAEPLRLKRSYISAKGFGSWFFFENLIAQMFYSFVCHLFIPESTGTSLKYECVKEDKKTRTFRLLHLGETAKGLTDTARGTLSAHTKH